MARRIWRIAAVFVLIPSLAFAQDRVARPGNGPQAPQRPGNGGPQIQPPRPGGPQIQPPRPDRPQIQPPRPSPGHLRPPHFDHRPSFHRPPHYRPHPYRYPHGYAYRRWHIGAVLPHILFGSTYYFSDYHLFGLSAPPRHYRWFRYGPDLILVNTQNGHVRDVHYGVFR